MAFFEERIEKGVIAKLQGIVDSEFVRMDSTVLMDCMALEQDIEAHAQRLAGEMERMEKIRNRVRRLRHI